MTTRQLPKVYESNGLRRYVPFLSWIRSYDRGWLSADVIAGLTLWGMVVPEAMAYAGVAGLPPQMGLYTLVAALLVYALFGSSRHLVVQATSATAALIASTVTAVIIATGAATDAASIDPATYQQFAAAFVLVVGAVFLIAAVARLGFITQFLSKPVMDGFVSGLAIFVAVGQLNKLFGVPKGSGNVIQKIWAIIQELPQANWVAFIVGASALALLFLIPRVNKKLPAGLIVLFGYIALSATLALGANYEVDVVGELPQGLPSISLPVVPVEALLAMIAPAIGVLLVAFSEALGVAREFAEKHGYEVEPNQELTGHALANLASSLFGGMVAAGSMSASAVKEAAGARSQVTNLVTWLATIVTVLFLTPLFKSLPEAVLAALIIHAVWHIIASRKLRRIRLESRTEYLLGALTFAGVILIDVLQGMLLGLIVSLIVFIYRSIRPHLSRLGRVPNMPGAYSDLTRHPENTPVPGVLILRLDAPLYYANALTVAEQVKRIVAETDPRPRAVLFDAAAQDELDITSAEVLRSLYKGLKEQGIDVYLAEVHAPVREFAGRMGLQELVGDDHFYPTVDAAVKALTMES
jgi:high affinity sulfate transporter 1